MTKSEVINKIAESNAVTKEEAKRMYNAVVEVVTDALKNGEDVVLPELGKFITKTTSERTAKNPITKEPMTIPSKKVIRFKVCKTIKDIVASL